MIQIGNKFSILRELKSKYETWTTHKRRIDGDEISCAAGERSQIKKAVGTNAVACGGWM